MVLILKLLFKYRLTMKMKKLFYILTIVLSLISFGCTKGFEDINTSKDQFVKLEPEYLFASSVKGSMDLMAELNANMYWPYAHQLTVSSMSSTAMYGASYSTINGWWARFYQNISLLRKIQTLYGGKVGYENRVQIAKVWESYMFYVFTTTFGGIPYKDACRDDLINIPFDSENDIYISLLKTLETATKTLDPTKDALKPDILFTDSDINKWKKFANSLRLKIALETQNAIPVEATANGKDVVNNYESLLPQSNSENITFQWGGTTSSENSYYYNTWILNTTKVLPAISELMFDYMRTYTDPRMQVLFDKVQGQYLVFDTLYTNSTKAHANYYRYQVPYNGKPMTTQVGGMTGPGVSGQTGDPYRSMSDNQYSYLKASYLQANAKQNLIWYADVSFMLAEAKLLGWGGSKTVDQYYYNGINASYNQYGLTTTQANAYENLNGVKWGTANLNGSSDHLTIVNVNIPNDPLHQIIVQRWLAGTFDGGHDAWCYLRRTREINLTPCLAASVDAMNTGNVIANLPERLQYPNTEQNYNTISYNAAVQKLSGGADALTTYLNIAKPYTRLTYNQWLVWPIKYSWSAWAKWYGPTEQDLITGGLVINNSYFIETILY
jgi:hypothetical protein